jgi:hypothetical protein
MVGVGEKDVLSFHFICSQFDERSLAPLTARLSCRGPCCLVRSPRFAQGTASKTGRRA